jgi:hypothetical protein
MKNTLTNVIVLASAGVTFTLYSTTIYEVYPQFNLLVCGLAIVILYVFSHFRYGVINQFSLTFLYLTTYIFSYLLVPFNEQNLSNLIRWYPLSLICILIGYELATYRSEMNCVKEVSTLKSFNISYVKGNKLVWTALFAASSLFIVELIPPYNKLINGVYFIVSDMSKVLLVSILFVVAAQKDFFKYVLVIALFVLGLAVAPVFRADYSLFRLCMSSFLVLLSVIWKMHFNGKSLRPALCGAAILSLIITTFCTFFLDIQDVYFFLDQGDLLVLKNGVGLYEYTIHNNVFKPYMFLHNVGLYMIPEALKPISVPENYNYSSWYLSNVRSINPDYYNAGVGFAGVPAAFLSGGVVGLLTIYTLAGAMQGFLYRLLSVYGSAAIGIFFWFAIRMPLGMYRMSPEFYFGRVFILVPTIILCLKLIVKHKGSSCLVSK